MDNYRNSNVSADFDSIKKKISNPASFGPGIWYCIHRMARDATTEEKKIKFQEFIENIIVNLPCSTCTEHAVKYYSTNPLDRYWSIDENGTDIGLFRWAWQFHNTVNARLNKPLVSWDSAKMLFLQEDGICTTDCGSNEPVQVSMIHPTSQKSIDQLVESSVHGRRSDPLQRFIPKNILRPNSIEKSKSNRFRNV
jgi:hypothetical protein